ncbi:MAG: hypothetical protein HY080_09725 [Gammaproteobacteria bacterium]|nr:hypothetical protein [Gammaproteobacteria bacterium]
MSTCTHWVDKGVITCKQWAQTTRRACQQYAQTRRRECTQQADQGYSRCDNWQQQTQKSCDTWDKHCCGWWPCSWACKIITWVCVAWSYITTWVCKAYVWVSKEVCIAWATLVEWGCILWTYITEAACLLWSWLAKLVCIAWDNIRCAFTGLLRGIFPARRADPRIRHVFVLMLENRSFDHLLGFSDIRGTDAQTGAPTQINNLIGRPQQNTDPATGTVYTTATPADYKLTPANQGPGHEFNETLEQLAGPGAQYPDPVTHSYPAAINNSGYVANYSAVGSDSPGKVMNVFAPNQLPILNQLAQEFAVCDNWYCALPGPTWPNRMFVHAASSGGLDDSPSNFEVVTSTLLDGYRFDNGTIYDRLEDQCREWLVFEGDENPQVLALSGMTLNAAQGRFRDFEDFRDSLNDPKFSASYTFIEPNYGNILPWTAGDYTCGNSQHPLDDVARGEKLIKDVYESIRNSPHWESSLLIITYDEHGGFYDHCVPPKTVHPGDGIPDADNNHHNFDFTQLGVRVPAVIVSPYIQRGIIDHAVYDHSSVIKTVAELFGFGTLTKRDTQANSLRHLLSLTSPRSDAPTTLSTVPDSGWTCEDNVDAIVAATGADKVMRQQTQLATQDMAASEATGKKQIDPSLRGFLHVAFLRHHALVPYRQRKEILQQFLAVRTNTQAREFILNSKKFVRSHKLRHPQKKAWQARAKAWQAK